MKKITTFLVLLCLLCSRRLPAQQDSAYAVFNMDDVPESEINIPVEIDMAPLFDLAAQKVDTLFTSPGYPHQWVADGCATRYKYSFRRSPLQFNFENNRLTIGFTGYYKIIGATRACVNGKAVTPWTPECKCGFDEGERKVNVSFTITPVVLVNYVVKLSIARNEPVPIDRCAVCFWEHDITPTIMKALSKELDLSKSEMEKNFGRTDLKPQFQKLWHILNTPYNVNAMGWLQINPQKFRLNRLYGVGNKLYINIGLAAKPVVKFEKPNNPLSPVPNLYSFSRTPGFNIYVDAMLHYDSLSHLLNRQIAGKSYSFQKAFVRKTFVFDECKILPGTVGRLRISIKFSGTDQGYFFLSGIPVFDAPSNKVMMKDLAFDIRSRDAVLKMADLLFSKKITAEIEKMAQYDLTELVTATKNNAQQQLNRELAKGVKGIGTLNQISIVGIRPGEKRLEVRINAKGSFSLAVRNVDFSL